MDLCFYAQPLRQGRYLGDSGRSTCPAPEVSMALPPPPYVSHISNKVLFTQSFCIVGSKMVVYAVECPEVHPAEKR